MLKDFLFDDAFMFYLALYGGESHLCGLAAMLSYFWIFHWNIKCKDMPSDDTRPHRCGRVHVRQQFCCQTFSLVFMLGFALFKVQVPP